MRNPGAGSVRPLGGQVRSHGILGWTASPRPELLFYRVQDRPRVAPSEGGTATDWGESARKTRLIALDTETRAERLVAEFVGGRARIWASGTDFFDYTRPPTRAWDWIPTWVSEGDSLVLSLVDTATGKVVRVAESACLLWGFSPDGTKFFYGRCSGAERFGAGRVELRRFDVVSGADEEFTTLDGYSIRRSRAREISVSPDGESLLLYARVGRNEGYSTHLVERTGVPRTIIENSQPFAWRNSSEAIVALNVFEPQFFIVDRNTGQSREVLR